LCIHTCAPFFGLSANAAPSVAPKTFADLVDWHALADLVDRGCSPRLALEIVR
jgi:hypothetical protein